MAKTVKQTFETELLVNVGKCLLIKFLLYVIF
jgi:hypothetical protein